MIYKAFLRCMKRRMCWRFQKFLSVDGPRTIKPFYTAKPKIRDPKKNKIITISLKMLEKIILREEFYSKWMLRKDYLEV